jgi:hypothetical protein
MVCDRRQRRSPNTVASATEPVDLPAQVTAEIERSAAYRLALAKLLSASGEFEVTLSAVQRARWLALEDAMFEYAQVYGFACYGAGRRAGRRPRR